MHAPAPRVVLCHGTWDLLHLGHIRHLQEARAQGDRLVVSVTADRHVNKGHGRPHFPAEQRMEALAALGCVDDVVLSEAPDAVDVIRQIRPAVYVKGVDYSDIQDRALQHEIAAVEASGGRFHVTQSDKWSSSRLLNAERYDGRTLAFLDEARNAGYRDKILRAFDKADTLKIAFVGETIYDEYRYVRALSKPSKEFVLATVAVNEEVFHGGIVAASRHAEWPKATVVTGPSLRKTRFVDADFNRKLFEVYSVPRLEMTERDRWAFDDEISAAVIGCDAIVVADFGHGLIGLSQRETLAGAKFLAVNSQSNAGNFGFNPVTRYARADLVCVDDPEARLATGMQTEPIDGVVRRLEDRMATPGAKVIVTHGKHGCVAYHPPHKPWTIPAFASHGVDTMGAGDAFLAVAAPLVAAGLELPAAAFMGNIAGAIKVSIVGHRRHVGRAELVQTMETLLK